MGAEDLEYRKNHITGRMEKWRVGYMSSLGYTRGTSTPDIFLGEVSDEEWAGIEAKNAEILSDRAAEKAERKTTADVEAAYWAALPQDIAGFRRGHIGRAWELEDRYGNFVLALPKKAALEGWPCAKLAAWIEIQTAEGYGE